MFDRLRKAFGSSPADGYPSYQDVAAWAVEQKLSIVPHAVEEGHFELTGDLDGHPWRLECGASTRDYLRGLELRGRADVGADPDVAVMLINRPLKEALEGTAYSAITDTLQTTVSANLPEEIRWLAMCDEVDWPELPASFYQHFAVVTDRIEHAQRWVHAPVVMSLLGLVESEGGAANAESPVLLMLMRGKVYLRMQHTRRSLPEVAQAVQVLLEGAQSALRHLQA
ncbi:MAG: hypothetical protein QM569_13680 [Acidovorax sp.]|uniref:hypothetical protein n=1 Tax=Acidovorax sp. TaxID=1872122 RepID=UPI0039E347C1